MFLITATMVISLSLTGTAVVEYQPLIEYYSKANDLDPTLVAAIILTESSGNAKVVNPVSGAVGLMQIMPYEAGPPFLDRPTIQQLHESEMNIAVGCEILADLFERKKTLYNVLFYYSGGPYWNSMDEYRNKYYEVVLDYMEGLNNGGLEHSNTYFSSEFIDAYPQNTELPRNRY